MEGQASLGKWAGNGLTVTGDLFEVTCYGPPLEPKSMEGRTGLGKWADNGTFFEFICYGSPLEPKSTEGQASLGKWVDKQLTVSGDLFEGTSYGLPLEATPLCSASHDVDETLFGVLAREPPSPSSRLPIAATVWLVGGSVALTLGPGPWPWALAHGRGPWPMPWALAMAVGPGPRPWPAAVGPVRWPWTLAHRCRIYIYIYIDIYLYVCIYLYIYTCNKVRKPVITKMGQLHSDDKNIESCLGCAEHTIFATPYKAGSNVT